MYLNVSGIIPVKRKKLLVLRGIRNNRISRVRGKTSGTQWNGLSYLETGRHDSIKMREEKFRQSSIIGIGNEISFITLFLFFLTKYNTRSSAHRVWLENKG